MTTFLIAASLGDTITDGVSEIAKALRYPVLILALAALLFVVWELGRLGVEAYKRGQRTKTRFDDVARTAMQHAQGGDSAGAQAVFRSYAHGDALQRACIGTLFAPTALDAMRAVIDYDLYTSKRLDRVRLLVRSGPALGLMGTLIPLAPALAALGEGDAKVLADELQTAFAITVVGVMIGLVAFTVALLRERYYTRDLSDLEYLRELRGDAGSLAAANPAPAVSAAAVTALTVTPPAAIEPSDSKPGKGATAPGKATPAATGVDKPAATSPSAASAISAPDPAVAPFSPPPVPAAAAPPSLEAEAVTKKKFGVKRKTPKPSADVPLPAAFPPPPPPAAIPGVTPVQDKSPRIPDPPTRGSEAPDADPTGGDSS